MALPPLPQPAGTDRSQPLQFGYATPLGTLAVLPPELRETIFEFMFPEYHTTVSFTVFCNLRTELVETYRLRGDYQTSSPGTLATLVKFRSHTAGSISGPLADEVMAVFWKNVKVVINIQDKSSSKVMCQPYNHASNFLEQAAGKTRHLVLRLFVRNPAASQALRSHQYRNFYFNDLDSITQVFEITTFGRRTTGGRCPGLSINVSQWLGPFTQVANTADAVYRRDWCERFLKATGAGSGGGLPGGVLAMLLLKVTSFSLTRLTSFSLTAGRYMTLSPPVSLKWRDMSARRTAAALLSGSLITPAGHAVPAPSQRQSNTIGSPPAVHLWISPPLALDDQSTRKHAVIRDPVRGEETIPPTNSRAERKLHATHAPRSPIGQLVK